MSEQKKEQELSEEEKLKQMAARMREAEYKGLSEEEILERERQKEERRKKNIEILSDTLDILNKGYYEKDGQEIKLQFSSEEMRKAKAFLPSDIEALRNAEAKSTSATEYGKQQITGTTCTYGCENADTLVLAEKEYKRLKAKGEASPKILVLNMASSTTPGGRTRDGAGAQEEDLCRRTSLLLSLECEDAKKYYDFNNAKKTHMGSDGVIISPNVEVIKDASAKNMSEPFAISVMSCAAPMIRMGLEGMSKQEYEEMYYNRIYGMLSVAASQKYRHLILGAFGCGIFGNDAAVVSDLFYRAIKEFTYAGKESNRVFSSINFAVLCRPDKDYNYKEFCRNFAPGRHSD